MSKEQAFPGYRRVQRMGYQTDAVEPVGGMSLRDYFAAKAMQSLAMGPYDSASIARAAYTMADAMLRERDRPQT